MPRPENRRKVKGFLFQGEEKMENRNIWSLNKYWDLVLKLVLATFLVGFAIRIFISPFAELEVTSSPEKEQEPVMIQPVPVVVDVPKKEDKKFQEKCDLLTGEWIPNPSGPIYTNETCPWIEAPQNCLMNGRPDKGYMYWRWKPHSCNLPQFDAKKFLEIMRNKTWALIGDSISRNHVQSLVCALSTVEKADLVYHDEEYKSKKWHFPSHNFTLSNIWSPFLVEALTFEDMNGLASSEVQLHLDKLDTKWTSLYHSLDYMTISTGQWFFKPAFYHENDTIIGCHICPSGSNTAEVEFEYAYIKTLKTVMKFITNSGHKGTVFFRTSTPDHFENGEWHNGGSCPKTSPVKRFEIKYLNRHLVDMELGAFEEVKGDAAAKGVDFRVLDFTDLLLVRPDGHPGPYRNFHPFEGNETGEVQNDCLHWCLPGPLEAWNDVIMEIVVNGRGN